MNAVHRYSPVLCLLASCGADPPPPKLQPVDVVAAEHAYEVIFDSDVQFYALFAKNRNQRVIYSEFICSLDGNTSLEFGDNLTHFGQGIIEPVTIRPANGAPAYRFNAAINFWRAQGGDMDDEVPLSGNEIQQLLRHRSAVPCKVRMTIYLSTPYYSQTMMVPVELIRAAVAKSPPPDVHFPSPAPQHQR